MQIAVLQDMDLDYYFKQPTMPDGSPTFSTPEERGGQTIERIFQMQAYFYDELQKQQEVRMSSPVYALTTLRKYGIPMKACLALAKKIGQKAIDERKTVDNPKTPTNLVS